MPEVADSFAQRINGLGAFAGYASGMNSSHAITLADRAAPLAVKLFVAANLLFLGSFLVTLAAAVEIATQ